MADLHVLQELAEWATGEQALPIVLVTMQHLAFEEYVTGASVGQRREWSKVLGRFADIPYVESPAESQALISAVFERSTDADLKTRLTDWSERGRAEIEGCGVASALRVSPADCYPLHPVVTVALPELCSRYGQNERTLFSFLAGRMPTPSVPSPSRHHSR